jgi:hypothetical protein
MGRRSARSSGQWAGQRRLCKEYMAGIQAKTQKHQTIGAASAVETHVELYSVSVEGVLGRLTILIVISHPVCVLQSRILLSLPINPSVNTRKGPPFSSVKCLISENG